MTLGPVSHQEILRPPPFPLILLALVCSSLFLLPRPVLCGAMVDDPKGFHGIPWGAAIAESPDLVLADSSERIKQYDLKNGPLLLGEAKVESMRFVTIDGQFARVTVRYRGKKTHDLVLAYLRKEFGPTDFTPGQMMRGLNQQFNWRGTETEVNLTYDGGGERGYVFFDSRLLQPKFNEGQGDTVP